MAVEFNGKRIKMAAKADEKNNGGRIRRKKKHWTKTRTEKKNQNLNFNKNEWE